MTFDKCTVLLVHVVGVYNNIVGVAVSCSGAIIDLSKVCKVTFDGCRVMLLHWLRCSIYIMPNFSFIRSNGALDK